MGVSRRERAEKVKRLPSSRSTSTGAGFELTGEHAHADEVAAMDALEALGDDGAHAEEQGALGGPVAR
jgi:hypothetical protein